MRVHRRSRRQSETSSRDGHDDDEGRKRMASDRGTRSCYWNEIDLSLVGDRTSVMGRCATFAVFACALGWLMLFDPWAPFSREVGVCEAGAVRDVLAGNFILPSYDPQARFRPHYQPSMPREREWGPGGMVQPPPLYCCLSPFPFRFLGLDEFALRR